MKEKHLDIDPPALGPGLVGLVQAAAHLMDADAADLLGVSSAAFCNYVFDPHINQHEATRREFSRHAALFSNYGPWESIAYYTGWSLNEVNALSAIETLKVIVFEIEGGRPIVTLTPDLEPALITGYRVSTNDRVVCTTRGEFEVRDETRLQGDDEVFRNWHLLVRPSQQPQWAASQVRQRVAVLRWALEHATNTREFFQETRENYAPGLEGIRRFRELLVGLRDPAGVRYAESYTCGLRLARQAAATCVADWADPIAEELAAPAAGVALRAAASAYQSVADALAPDRNFADAMAEAHTHELQAVAALGQAAVDFPDAFEGG